jgi:hypothetical protein
VHCHWLGTGETFVVGQSSEPFQRPLMMMLASKRRDDNRTRCIVCATKCSINRHLYCENRCRNRTGELIFIPGNHTQSLYGFPGEDERFCILTEPFSASTHAETVRSEGECGFGFTRRRLLFRFQVCLVSLVTRGFTCAPQTSLRAETWT